MKVLLVNGSPHENGSTSVVLKEAQNTFLVEGIETEIFWIGNKPISGCIACYSCKNTGKCVFDDTVNQFLPKAKQADGFIFGAPVHYAAMASGAAAFMDRIF